MQEFNFNQHITQLLKADNRLVDEENDIQINILRDLVNNLDSQLIELLIADDKVREKFFIKVKDVYVFKQNDFIFYLDSKVLDGSYTQYANRIGLASGGKFLTDSTDYVLDFPYKDCVLEGGQSTEEGNDVYFEYDADAKDYVEKTAKRKEIFYNNIIAKDEIDRLLEPKAFQKVVRYDANGGTIPTSFNRDAELNSKRGLPEDTITDNLIIKGNNLLALHSLEKEFKGKVKLIYIDPPYNTGNDSFAYNDKFNHSAWLTFMYNRLKIAKSLLLENGVIFIQSDDNEQSYLKILMDEVFKKQNYVETFVWKNTDNAPTLSKKSRKNIEFIHCYEKVLDTSIGYTGRDSDNDDAPLLNSGNPITVLEFPSNIIKFRIPDGTYPKGNYDKIELLDDLVVKEGKNVNKIKLRGRFKWQQSFLNSEVSIGTYFLIKSNKFSIRYQRSSASNIAPDKLIDGQYLSKAMGVETNEDSKKHIDSLNLNFNSYPKPESLIGFLIKSVSKEGDIVLDFHLGSGTTAAVAHKMNRQYIGVEQMDYVETISLQRLNKVIGGEQGGISKTQNWQGGGSFIYAELAKNNETAKERIDACNSLEELLQLFEELNTRYFLDYNVRIKDFKENAVKEEAFINLSLARQKELFKRMLDNNQLYVNLSEVEDARYNLSEDAIRLTKDFYQIKN